MKELFIQNVYENRRYNFLAVKNGKTRRYRFSRHRMFTYRSESAIIVKYGGRWCHLKVNWYSLYQHNNYKF